MYHFHSFYKGVFLILSLCLIGLSGCKKDNNQPVKLTPYQQDNVLLSQTLNLPGSPYLYADLGVPAHLNSYPIYLQDNTPSNNPTTNEGATLGRVLFYDKKLSSNQTISCASCHIQSHGFSDTLKLSKGFEGGLTGRHSMGLSNARFRYNGHFFWDERASTLEEQVLGPIQDPIEMGMNLSDLTLILENNEYYPILFRRAFGDSAITSKRISMALAQFVRSMVSFNSKYDQGRKNHEINEDFDNFSADENMGKQLFHSVNKGMCSNCHFTEAMVTDIARNNGLSREPDDIGLQGTTNNPMDRGKFKAPSLRNIAVRAPYMHNGDYKTLKDVISAYSSGISWSPTLDKHLMQPGNTKAIRFNLSAREIAALEAFLHTLTDQEFLENVIYSNPFKKP